MASYLLIASRDPFEAGEVARFYELAAGLVAAGNQVSVFLCQNGVLPVRRSSGSGPLSRLAELGVELLADDFSLRERGIARDRMIPGVKVAPIDAVVDALEAGRKVVWH